MTDAEQKLIETIITNDFVHQTEAVMAVIRERLDPKLREELIAAHVECHQSNKKRKHMWFKANAIGFHGKRSEELWDAIETEAVKIVQAQWKLEDTETGIEVATE